MTLLMHYMLESKNDTSIEETVKGERYLVIPRIISSFFKKLANL